METQQNKVKEIEKKIKIVFTQKSSIINNETEKIIDEILTNKEGQTIIINKIRERKEKRKNIPQAIDGLIYQKIINIDSKYINEQLEQQLPQGIINLQNFNTVNYHNLQDLLINHKFQEADKLTQQYLCELTKQNNTETKNWLYFTDIQFLPQQDLFILDLLWKIYSKGKFGFSIQKKIWIKNHKNWDKLWKNICWLQHDVMKRYPEEFIWTIDAPEGHLPLSNQLRGTKTLLYIFHSIKW